MRCLNLVMLGLCIAAGATESVAGNDGSLIEQARASIKQVEAGGRATFTLPGVALIHSPGTFYSYTPPEISQKARKKAAPAPTTPTELPKTFYYEKCKHWGKDLYNFSNCMGG